MEQKREYVPQNVQRVIDQQRREQIKAKQLETYGRSLGDFGAKVGSALGSAFDAVKQNTAPGYSPGAVRTMQGAGAAAGSGPGQRGGLRRPGAIAPGGVERAGFERPKVAIGPVAGARPSITRPAAPPSASTAGAAPNTFVGTNTGTRTVSEDGSVSPAIQAPGTQAGTFNVVSSEAFTRPGLGTLGIAAGRAPGASTKVSKYQQQVAQAQARNAATASATPTSTPPGFTDEQWRQEVMRRTANSMQSGKQTRTQRQATSDAQAIALGTSLGEVTDAQRSAQQLRFASQQQQGDQAIEAQRGAAQVQANRESIAARLQEAAIAGDSAVRAASITRPQFQTGADGKLYSIGPDGATTVMADDGTPFRPQAQAQGSDLTAARLREYGRERASANQILDPAERERALLAIDQNPVYAQLFAQQGGGQLPAAAAPPAEAIERLRANPQEAALFDEQFGAGTAAQYLGG